MKNSSITWSSYVLLGLFALWFVTWTVKVIVGDYLNAFSLQPSALSILGIGSLVTYLLSRGRDQSGPWLFAFGLGAVSLGVIANLFFRVDSYLFDSSVSNALWSVQRLYQGLMEIGNPVPDLLREYMPIPKVTMLLVELIIAGLVLRRWLVIAKSRSFIQPTTYSRGVYLLLLLGTVCLFLLLTLMSLPILVSNSIESTFYYSPNSTLPVCLLPLSIAWAEVWSFVRR